VDGGVELLEPVAVGGSDRAGDGRLAPELIKDLNALVEDATRGDPESPPLWVSRSASNLADALTARGHRTNRTMVGDLLRGLGFSLQANIQTRRPPSIPTATRSSATACQGTP
jgi:hypothetical protein